MTKPLNILTVNWNWFNSGGDWTYVENVSNLYKSRGHKIIPFSMKSERNFDAGGFEKYFVDHIDYKELNKSKNLANGVKAVSKSIYSIEAKKALQLLLTEHPVDAAHLHNINHYITPSILPVLKKKNIPIIWTLHDYTLICPENSFISNGKICENCRGGTFFHCATQRCKKGSLLASSLAAIENYTHRYLNVFKHVDYFLCPSQFLLNKFREFNFYPEKLVLANNCFTFNRPEVKPEREDYLLYVGRLAKTKGLYTLLKAAQGLECRLIIAGEGPEKNNLASYISEHKMDQVTLAGFKSHAEIKELMARARMLICPSEWYENFPSVVIEAMSMMTPVIGSKIGGIPELVVHEETGLLFQPFDHLDLRAKIKVLLNDDLLCKNLAEKAYIRTSEMAGFDRHYEVLKTVYARMGLQC